MEAIAVSRPVWLIEYEGKDITAEIAPFVTNVTYTDRLEGESDEVEIVLDDREGRWKDRWYPEQGSRLTVRMGYDGRPLMPCGVFELDEIELAGPPDTVTLRGVAAGIKPALRTKKSRAFEGVTLRQIAERVARENGLRLAGVIDDIRLGRVTQNQEYDLAFLKRISDDYGQVFSVRGDTIIYHELAELQKTPPVLVIDRGQMTRWRMSDKTSRVYCAARVRYFDPKTKKVIETSVDNKAVKGGDSLIITERCENKAQAIKRARAALKKANIRQVEGEVAVIGDPRLVAGNNVELTGLGRLSGVYQIRVSRHLMDRSGGYRTEIEVISHA